jgi:hypothetical protein
MEDTHAPWYGYIGITVFLIIVIALLSAFAIVPAPSLPGVSALYIAVGFMIAFTLWFGDWGAIATYAGGLIGTAMTSGIPLFILFYVLLANLWQVMIPLTAFRYFNADPGLVTRYDWKIYLIFGLLVNNLVGAIWGAGTLLMGGIISTDQVLLAFSVWFGGNLLVTLVITTLLLLFVTPRLRHSPYLVKKWWC